jgi:hypothetical protein
MSDSDYKNGWNEHAKLVLAELYRLNKNIESLGVSNENQGKELLGLRNSFDKEISELKDALNKQISELRDSINKEIREIEVRQIERISKSESNLFRKIAEGDASFSEMKGKVLGSAAIISTVIAILGLIADILK